MRSGVFPPHTELGFLCCIEYKQCFPLAQINGLNMDYLVQFQDNDTAFHEQKHQYLLHI